MTSLRAALAGVDARLAARTRTRAAALAAATVAVPAWALISGLPGAAAVAVAAAVAAGLSRPDGGRAAAWLDRHGADDDLIISGAAVVDGRVATALADDVVVAAGGRVAAARRPTRGPVVAGALAIAALALAVGTRAPRGHGGAWQGGRGGPDERQLLTAVAAGDRGLGVAGVDAPIRPPGAVIIGGPRPDHGPRERPASPPAGVDRAADRAPPAAEPGSGGGSARDRRDPGGGGTGAGAGDRGGTRPTTGQQATAAEPATARGVLTTTAPRAGAQVEIVGVPARYRELVAAYLAPGEDRP